MAQLRAERLQFPESRAGADTFAGAIGGGFEVAFQTADENCRRGIGADQMARGLDALTGFVLQNGPNQLRVAAGIAAAELLETRAGFEAEIRGLKGEDPNTSIARFGDGGAVR